MSLTKFVYIDESITESASLVSLEVDIEKIDKVLRSFYLIIEKILNRMYPEKGSNVFYPPPVLHGRDFLRNTKEGLNREFDFSNINDDFRLQVIDEIVSLINENNLRIVRFGFSNHKSIINIIKNDDKLHGLNWSLLSRHFGKMADNNYTFIVDGVDIHMMDHFSRFLRDARHAFYNDNLCKIMPNSLLLPNIEKFKNNVFYVNDEYCEFLQIIDIIGEILKKSDCLENPRKKNSEYCVRIGKIKSKIKSSLLIDNISYLNIK